MLPSTSRLRVALDAHVVGRRQTGNETYVRNLAGALAEREDIELLTYLDSDAMDESIAGTHRPLRARAPQLRIPLELPWRARADGAAVLHVQYVAPPISLTPIVNAVHDISFEDLPDLFSRSTTLRLKASIRFSVRRARAVLALSAFTRERILHHYDIAPERVVVAHAGVDRRWQRLPEAEIAGRLEASDLPPRFVLAVGNLHPRKNLPRLIRAVAEARRLGVGDVGLVIAGQRGWRGEDVSAEIARADGADWVRLTGYVSDDVLEALYNRASVVCYPSLYEGFGLPVAEALAIGAVVVASDATSIPEVAGDAAILVDPREDTAVTAGLISALTDDRLRARLMAAGPAQASKFTWAACAEATMAAYRIAVG
jgi:glycosyltransferase involved in cell wall biosynthesis